MIFYTVVFYLVLEKCLGATCKVNFLSDFVLLNCTVCFCQHSPLLLLLCDIIICKEQKQRTDYASENQKGIFGGKTKLRNG